MSVWLLQCWHCMIKGLSLYLRPPHWCPYLASVMLTWCPPFCRFFGEWKATIYTLSAWLMLVSLFFFFFYCSGFCHTLKWNSHGFTCVPHPDPPSHLPLHPIPLGLPSAPGRKSTFKNDKTEGVAKMVEMDRETTFSPTNSWKEHLNPEQTTQNNFWSLAEDIRHSEKQPIVFKRR